MQQTMINHPRLTVEKQTGTEGPSHDPYGYSEFTAKTPRGTFVLHEGLVCWFGVPTIRNKVNILHTGDQARLWWEAGVGFTLAQIERIYNRLTSQCRKCGSRNFRSERGYPGEHFAVCENGHVTDYFFCESEIE